MLNLDDPQKLMLLMMGAGLLSHDPRQKPNFGNDLSRGLMSGIQGYGMGKQSMQAEQDRKMQQEERQMRMDALKRQTEQQSRMDSLAQNSFGPVAPQPSMDDEGNRMPPVPQKFDMQGYAQGLMGVDPAKGIGLLSQIQQMNKPDLLTVPEGASVYDRRNPTAGPVMTGAPKLPPGMTMGANGPEYMPAYLKGQAEIRAAGRPNIDLKVNSFTPASETAQAEFMKGLRATYDQLKHVPAAIQNIEKTKALIPAASGFMGPGGESLLDAAKFLNNRLGTKIDVAGVKSAEEVRSRIFFNIMDNLKKMDAAPSQMQQQTMQEALGKLGTDPNALPAVLDAYTEVLKDKVGLHNQEAEGAVARGVKFPYDPVIRLEKLPPGLVKNQTALYKARQAIKDGKDPEAVRQRLIEQGFDPRGL